MSAAEFFDVNNKIFGRILLVFVSIAGMTFGADLGVVAMGDKSFTVSKQASTTFNRDTEALKASALHEAEAFCEANGKKLKVVTWSVYKPRFISGYANAKLVFKALDAGDPELTTEPSPAPVNSAAGADSDDFYAELLKLDDLRKRGILTEKEFAAQKKKALKRAR